ncbi:MAG TPA: hypothetical protein VFK69_13275, partial [Candidatus Eisenbacteria bacterium]|nr:hypothetical protein [Candidatus Eisenbacteria bacterium]
LALLLPGGAAHARIVGVRVGPCTLEAPASAGAAVSALSPVVPRVLQHIETELGAGPRAPFVLALLPPHVDDAALAALDRGAPPWAAGFMMPARRIGAIRLAAASRQPWSSPESAMAHELTHLVLHDADDDRLPRWFDEGVAMYEERRFSPPDLLGWGIELARGTPPTLAQVSQSFPAAEGGAARAYAMSSAFVGWSVRRHGPDFLRRVVVAARTAEFARAWSLAAGVSLASDEAAWRAGATRDRFWLLATASGPLWLGGALLVVLGAARRRAQMRAQRGRWRDEERRRPPLVDDGPA